MVHLDVLGSMGIPATSVRLHARGTGSSVVGEFDLLNSVGTLEYHGAPLPALVYTAVPGSTASSRVYQGLAFGSRDVVVFWLYCGDGVYLTFFESTSGQPLESELAFGNCVAEVGATEREVVIPDLDIDIELVSGFTIDGPELTLGADGKGVLTTDQRVLDIYLFEVVDCTYCASTGWWELHSIFHDPETKQTVFGIFYLDQAEYANDEVALHYAFSFSDLWDPLGPMFFYETTWTTP